MLMLQAFVNPGAGTCGFKFSQAEKGAKPKSHAGGVLSPQMMDGVKEQVQSPPS